LNSAISEVFAVLTGVVELSRTTHVHVFLGG
jgi:hypothetical protein